MTNNSKTNSLAPRLRHAIVLVAVTAVLLAWLDSKAAASETVSFQFEEGKTLTARAGDQLLWQFNYAQDLPKPYFHPVAVSDGSVMTWNSPPDHTWHHGLWFCWKYINRVNYWEPNRQTGKPDGRTKWQVKGIEVTESGHAAIGMQLQYHPGDADPVMTEQRTITISPPEADGSYHFDWKCAFTAGPKEIVLDRTPLPHEPDGKAYGGYAGLSVRLAKELANRTAMTPDGPVKFNAQSRFRDKARAMDYAGKIADREVGIAICDHPRNLNHPSPWYAIRSNVMSYFSPAVICNAPHKLKPGENFVLQYRVIVHPDKWDADRLTNAYRRFVSDSGAKNK